MRALPKANDGENLFRFQCMATKLPEFEEQYLYAESMARKFRADFAWTQYHLLVELQGGIWIKGGGAHSRPSKIVTDMVRYQYAAMLGFFVLPFSPDEVRSGHALEWTMMTLRKRGWQG